MWIQKTDIPKSFPPKVFLDRSSCFSRLAHDNPYLALLADDPSAVDWPRRCPYCYFDCDCVPFLQLSRQGFQSYHEHLSVFEGGASHLDKGEEEKNFDGCMCSLGSFSLVRF